LRRSSRSGERDEENLMWTHDPLSVLPWPYISDEGLCRIFMKFNTGIFVNNQPDAQFFFMYVHFYSVHVSGSHVPIIRRINCINTTSGILVCHSVWMTVWCAGLDETRPNLHTKPSSIQSDIYQMSY